MAYSTIDDKQPKQTKESIATRIFLVCLSFLIMPLLIFSILIYFHEYRDNVEENTRLLRLIGEERTDLVEESLKNEKAILESIGPLLVHHESWEKDAFFKLLAERDGVTALFFASYDESKQLICQASSDPDMVGKNMTLLVEQAGRDRVLIDPVGEDNLFVFSPQREGVFGLSLSRYALLEQIEAKEHVPIPSTLSIVDSTNRILVSSREWVLGEVISVDKKISDDLFAFSVVGDEKIGVKLPIEGTPYFLLLDIPESVNIVDLSDYFLWVLSLFVVIILVGGGTTFWLTYRMAQPHRQLVQVMQEVGTGDLAARYEPDNMGFEINTLGAIFNDTVVSLIKEQHKVSEERIARDVLAHELEIGEAIHASLLPKAVPTLAGYDISATFLPAKEVGGDFYDLFVIESGHKVFIAIADTSGKGISACLYSLGVRSMLRAIVARSSNLEEVILESNKLFRQDTQDTGNFVTLWCGLLDTVSHELSYTNAGHNPALHLNNQGLLNPLTTAGMAIGAGDIATCEVKKTVFNTGETLCLYTDGVIDARDPNNERFGQERLQRTLIESATQPVTAMKETLVNAMTDFESGADQYDDTTLLIIRREI